MSRTDKDAPYWSDPAWWEATHECGGRPYDCDLPRRPDVKTYRERPYPEGCHWVFRWPPHSYFHKAPRWFVRHVWTGPQRGAARDQCRAAIKEQRATGVVDTVPTVQPARHGAEWLWC